ncbi:PLP-dependent cysteine synthase family protein [Kiloniella laminariae]|uniref:L-cysteine desulfhydrase Cds1 n=1 Tax=Kiloniella laminariae TaxID=454162 RepID=A0ABT4LKH3_9PROT|nr:PLP-dependent cysteine synthase family protein [Kiloniella laminariae]MCZ4280861.1 PLP-dependent cysteine synthase family protein [Kiloniella laminariae]
MRDAEKRQWVRDAVKKIEADYNRSSDTHLIKLNLDTCHGVELYFKDESTHPTGSLKHRLARSLFLYALCNGWICKDTPIVEASSGSTAISEAYFARLLGLRFIAVVPKTTAKGKIALIEFYGGECHLVEPKDIYGESQRLADELGGHYMDQFTYAERATDWRGNNNIAQSIFSQMALESYPDPQWVVASAGTGGTSATIGRYIRYESNCTTNTKLCIVDPEHSVFLDYFKSRDASLTGPRGSRIEGIGRPRVEPSFVPSVIDRMIRVPDAASIAAIHLLEELLGRKCGASTGTNLCGAFHLMSEMKSRNEQGSIVTLICDSGDRYLDTYYNESWRREQNLLIEPELKRLRQFLDCGSYSLEE